MIADYLSAGSLIEARIVAKAPAIKRVAAMGNLYSLLEAEPTEFLKQVSGQLPAAYVGFDGETIGDTTGDGITHVVLQRWLIVLVVGNYRNADRAEGVVDAAGPLLSTLVAALTGWHPSTDFTELIRQSAPRPGYLAGVGFFPLSFATALVVEGIPD
jgi:hypothetical protein